MRSSDVLTIASILATATAQFSFDGSGPFTSGFPFGSGNGPLPSGFPFGNGNDPFPSGFLGTGASGIFPSPSSTGSMSGSSEGTGIFGKILAATENAQETLRVLNLVTGADSNASPISYFIHFYEYLIGLKVLSAELNELYSLLNQLPLPSASTSSPVTSTLPAPSSFPSNSLNHSSSHPKTSSFCHSLTHATGHSHSHSHWPVSSGFPMTKSNWTSGTYMPSAPVSTGIIPVPPHQTGSNPGPFVSTNASSTVAVMKFNLDAAKGRRKRPLGPGPVIIGGGDKNNGSQSTNSSDAGLEKRICDAYTSFLGEDKALAQALSTADARASKPANFPSQGNLDDLKDGFQQYFDLLSRISSSFEGLFPSCREEVISDQSSIDVLASAAMQKLP